MSALAQIASNVDLIPGLEVRLLVLDAIEARRDADPLAIGYLGKIASSANRTVQRSAAEALKRIHTRDTLPFLAQLLDSNNPGVRQAAMLGLSRFVENLPIETQYNVPSGKSLVPQGPAPYRTPETDKYSLSTRRLDQAREVEYLQFWRSWSTATKERLMTGQ